MAQRREHDDEFTVVVDKHGGAAGVVTYEDIAEELLGGIEDETDTAIALATPTERAGSSTRRRLDKIAGVTGIDLPEEDDNDNEEPSGAMRRQLHGTARRYEIPGNSPHPRSLEAS